MLNFNDLRSKKVKEQMKSQQENASNRGGGKKVDERLYFPKLSKDDEDNVIDIRFLPSIHDKDGDPFHIAKFMKHGFDIGNKNVYIPCPKTIGEDCPMCKTLIWDENDKTVQAIYRQRKSKVTYYVNVYVIDDKQYPEENGTIRIMPFGVQMMKAIEDSIKEESVNMFDLFEEGATFRIRVKPKGKNPTTGKAWPSFEASAFRNPSVFLDGDVDKMKEIFEKTYDLKEFQDPSKIKSFEEIEKQLKAVGLIKGNTIADDDLPFDVEPKKEPVKKKEEKKVVPKKKKEEIIKESVVEDEVEEKPVSVDDIDDLSDDDIDSLIDEI